MRMLAIGFLLLAAATAGCSRDGPSDLAGPESASLARLDGADHGGMPLTTTLSGAEEVPPRSTPGSGLFVGTMNQGQGEICYELSVQNLLGPVVGAHIHRAPADSAGPVVVPLTAPTSGFSSGCVSVSRELIKAIRQNPERYYVNVHTTVYPPGEVRGQFGD